MGTRTPGARLSVGRFWPPTRTPGTRLSVGRFWPPTRTPGAWLSVGRLRPPTRTPGARLELLYTVKPYFNVTPKQSFFDTCMQFVAVYTIQ